MFEIQLSLGLTGFVQNNWKYRETQGLWFGRETADITYDDCERDLTKLFIERGI